MPAWTDLLRAIRRQPAHTLMRGAARFANVRQSVARARGWAHRSQLETFLHACDERVAESPFRALDRPAFVRELVEQGIATGLQLPAPFIDQIRHFAATNRCYADRDPRKGFRVEQRETAEAVLGKPILVAQYFNTAGQCQAIERLACDSVLAWIAGRYLGSLPTFVGANLWWTFPVQALESDRDRHAHLFHRDVDDFKFFKFFFYLTDVRPGDGAHVCVVASHRQPPLTRPGDPWNIRRYGDEEVLRAFGSDRIVEMCGPAGTGFAENTLCVHKGLTPTREARLLLQLQYALFDYGVMHDRRAAAALADLV